jgi:hypothetical protein
LRRTTPRARPTRPTRPASSSRHADLPNDLVSEAIVNYADTAPAEVAEHLAPFVMAHGPVPGEGDDHADGLGLLASAPVHDVLDLPADGLDALPATHDDPHGAFDGNGLHLDPADPFDLDFGGGHHDGHQPAHAAADEWRPADHGGAATDLGTDSDVTPYAGEPTHDLDQAAADLDSDTAHHQHHAMHEPDPDHDHPSDLGDWADH